MPMVLWLVYPVLFSLELFRSISAGVLLGPDRGAGRKSADLYTGMTIVRSASRDRYLYGILLVTD
jgi:hypothetical protein